MKKKLKRSIFKKTVYALSSFLLLASTFAGPRVEGLFRNASNAEITHDLVAVSLSIEHDSMKPSYLQVFFNTDSASKKIDFLQVFYRDSSFSDEAAVKVTRFMDLNATLAKDPNAQRQLFYSLLEMLTINNSLGISNFLKKYSPDYSTNAELLISNRVAALTSYKDILTENKNQKKADRINDQEEKDKYNDALKAGLYQDDEKVRLVRENTEFFWHVQLENLSAWFTNDSHQLSKLQFLSPSGPIEIASGDYTETRKGGYVFPSVLMLSYPDESPYKMKFIKATFYNRKDAYKNITQNLEEKRQASSHVPNVAPFLY